MRPVLSLAFHATVSNEIASGAFLQSIVIVFCGAAEAQRDVTASFLLSPVIAMILAATTG